MEKMKLKLKLPFVFAAFLLAIFAWSVSSPARADTVVKFDPFPKGLAKRLVDSTWRKDPEYKDYVKFFDMVPAYMIGFADVNGDKTPEIFARHSDDELGFCDKQGIACRLHIYAYAKGGLVEIGRMMAASKVIVSSMKTDNVNDLFVSIDGKQVVHYVWDGKKYEQKK